MQRISAFVYPNRVEIQADNDPLLTTRNRIVYARTIKIHRGIDNTILFTVKNSDQKPINLTGHTIYFNIISDSSVNALLLEVIGTIQDAVNGIFKVVVAAEKVDLLEQELYNYAIKLVNSSNEEILVYSDDFFTVRGQIQVLDGYVPAFRNSAELTLSEISASVIVSSAAIGSYPSGFSSQHSFQFYFNNFTGTITPQVTTDPVAQIENATWTDQSPVAYSGQNSTVFSTIDGNYSAIRFRINVTSGSVTKILSRS